MPSVAATLRQYPSHPAATLKHTAHGSPFRPILNTEHHIPRPRPRPSSLPPKHYRAPLLSASTSPPHQAMHTPTQIRRHCVTILSDRHSSSSQITALQGSSSSSNSDTLAPRHRDALPRKIASGVFFIDPSTSSPPSTRTLSDLSITHAVLARGSEMLYLGTSTNLKALFVGPHDPLSKVVAWMRAVRRLGACIIVSDVAAAAGFLVVELGLSPRSAWLRIARGLPPPGDLVFARLCALALMHSEKGEKVSGEDVSEGAAAGQGQGQGGSQWRGAPRSCRSMRSGTRGESGLKHVLVSSL